MKKIVYLFLVAIMFSNLAIASCSVTGGACSIDNIRKDSIKKSESQGTVKKQSKTNLKSKTKKVKFNSKKQDGKINYRLVKVKLI